MAKAGNVSTALEFDVAAWRQGVRDAAQILSTGLTEDQLKPLNDALSKVEDKVQKEIADAKSAVEKASAGAAARTEAEMTGAAKKSAGVWQQAWAGVSGQLAGVVASTVGLYQGVRFLQDSAKAADDYGDSLIVLRSALATVEEVDVEGKVREVESLARDLSMTMGILRRDTNETFATMVTRGFDADQARQLTILAANYAAKTGKPLAENAKLIADAANGAGEAMKNLGVQIDMTGDKQRDGEAAVLALKAAYGGDGMELVAPVERLGAAWNEVKLSVGNVVMEQDAAIEGAADYLRTLTETYNMAIKHDSAFQGVATVLGTIVDLGGRFYDVMTKNVAVAYEGAAALGNFALAGAALVTGDLDTSKELARQGVRNVDVAVRMGRELSDPETNPLWADASNDTARPASSGFLEGAKRRAEAEKRLSAEIESTRQETFAGRPAVDDSTVRRAQREASSGRAPRGPERRAVATDAPPAEQQVDRWTREAARERAALQREAAQGGVFANLVLGSQPAPPVQVNLNFMNTAPDRWRYVTRRR